jgi:hypothetical protein
VNECVGLPCSSTADWFPEIKLEGCTGNIQPLMAHLGTAKMDITLGYVPPNDSAPEMLFGLQYNTVRWQRAWSTTQGNHSCCCC